MKRSINKNPNLWEEDSIRNLKIAYHNIHSLQNKILDIKADQMLLTYNNIIIFGETWQTDNVDVLKLEGFNFHHNFMKRGKGLVIYYRDETVIVETVHGDEHLQMSAIRNKKIEIIGFYRSTDDKNFVHALQQHIIPMQSYLLIGDMNICSNKNKNHKVFEYLNSMGFELLTKEPTHIQGGSIDQAWIRMYKEDYFIPDVSIYSPIYNCIDHDALFVCLKSIFSDRFIGKIFFCFFNLSINICCRGSFNLKTWSIYICCRKT